MENIWVEYNGEPYYIDYSSARQLYTARPGTPVKVAKGRIMTLDLIESLPKITPPRFEIGDTVLYTGITKSDIEPIVKVIGHYNSGRYTHEIKDSNDVYELATPYELHKINL